MWGKFYLEHARFEPRLFAWKANALSIEPWSLGLMATKLKNCKLIQPWSHSAHSLRALNFLSALGKLGSLFECCKNAKMPFFIRRKSFDTIYHCCSGDEWCEDSQDHAERKKATFRSYRKDSSHKLGLLVLEYSRKKFSCMNLVWNNFSTWSYEQFF